MFFWQFAVPAVVVLFFFAPSVNDETFDRTFGSVLATGLGAGIAFIILVLLGSVVTAILLPPFAWLCNHFFGAQISVDSKRHGR
jgi:hypothetical protein